MKLANMQHEMFAQKLAAGCNIQEAYIQAGYKGKGAAQSGKRLSMNPEVAARVTELRREICAEIKEVAIKDVGKRLAAMDSRWQRLQRILETRTDEAFAADMAPLAELRQIEMSASKQLGQTTINHRHSGPDGGAIQVEVTDRRLERLSDDQLDQLTTIIRILERDDYPEPGDGGSGEAGAPEE